MISAELLFSLFFIFFMTTAGAACVFFFGKIKNAAAVNGFAAGIMLAASFWSLLLPAAEEAENAGLPAVLPVCAGFFAGCVLIFALERFFTRGGEIDEKSKCKRLLIAVTAHNVPEGIAVGVAFCARGFSPELAFGVALGIGLQNFPEGFATALPVKNCYNSRLKGFLFGTLSGAVEPVFGLIGAFLSYYLVFLQPFALAFSAGAMICVCVCDIVPESCGERLGAAAFALGFLVMTALDVAF